MTTYTIGKRSEFPEGQGTRVVVDGRDIAVFNIDGEFFAVQNNCPHKNLPLHLVGHEPVKSEKVASDGAKRGGTFDGCKINCPWHQAEWDLETGHSPQVKKRIPRYDIEVEDDTVRIHM